jgi:O-acetyl-ADP-ribose deacetylase (regulator of RNase III)
MNVDIVVNAANEALKMGGGVCGAIFSAAGEEALQRECDAIGGCDTGEAVITCGHNLPAKYIIHTVGPIWRGGSHNEAGQLAACYENSLRLAKEHDAASIAFPLISSGILGYPKDEALQIAVASIGAFLLKNDMTVYLVVFDRQSYSLSARLFSSIREYIDDHYADERTPPRLLHNFETSADIRIEITAHSRTHTKKAKRKLEDIVNQLDESFSEMTLRLIDEKGKTDAETYKRANIDRKLFSKIRAGRGYNPKKNTALALAIALELNLDETRDLLARAGHAMSHSSKSDIIIEYFIKEGNFNIFEINEALFAFDQPALAP